MAPNNRKQSAAVWVVVAFLIWLVVNIRVEAGIANPYERALDGFVGGILLLYLVSLALRFFNCRGLDCQSGKSS